mgnify:CR=1 FL=1
MEYAEIKTKNVAELKTLLAEEQARLFKLRQQAHAGVLKQHHLLTAQRKTVARIMKGLSDASGTSR